LNPADHGDAVGHVTEVNIEDARKIAALAAEGAHEWARVAPTERAACLDRAADIMQDRVEQLMGIIMREAGKSAANAIGEVREAIDFLRYYADQARRTLGPAHAPLGAVLCISPWNFPLAIFTGQVAAAVVADNSVMAKPAGVTPIIAYESVKILHEGGVPRKALQFVPGSGGLASAIIDAPETAGVMFTGSTGVARMIQAQLVNRLSTSGRPIPLIAETGGQNGMIVDSSVLAEQVVADVITSAFDSGGQRCSALRVLCLQEDIADRTLTMLKGAMQELTIGRTDRLSTDVGPVITDGVKAEIDDHIARMKGLGCRVEQLPLPQIAALGTFIAPTIIELKSLSDLTKEIFGPVLHVIRYKREDMDRLIDDINASGYGLTFGLHTRLDETIAHVTSRVQAGNLYVNRNIIGAVVGVQPIGGRGLSGTGPKAGGRSISAVSSRKHRFRPSIAPFTSTQRFRTLRFGCRARAGQRTPRPHANWVDCLPWGLKRNLLVLSASATSTRFTRVGVSFLARSPNRDCIGKLPPRLRRATRSPSTRHRDLRTRHETCRQALPNASAGRRTGARMDHLQPPCSKATRSGSWTSTRQLPHWMDRSCSFSRRPRPKSKPVWRPTASTGWWRKCQRPSIPPQQAATPA
jgi:delta-1-pyrroline-5-carboxylate dehydrogenase PutA-like protein